MSRINSRSNNFVEGTITNIVKNDDLKNFTVSFNSSISSDNDVIFRNSIFLRDAFEAGRSISIKKLEFRNLSNVLLNHVNQVLVVESSSFQAVDGVNHVFLVCTWTPGNYDNIISNNFSFNPAYSSEPNKDNIVTYSKIGAPKHSGGSGIISSPLKKLINLNSFEMGTLPANKITTGKILQSLNDPYIEKNLIEFVQKSNVNTSLGIPIKNTSEDDGFYITTNESLLNSGSDLQISSNQYLSQYDLKNSKIAGSELNFDGQIISTRKVTKDSLDSLISKKMFQQDLDPFVESDYYFEEETTRSSFYTDTIDIDAAKGYNLGKQKQIKIILDFSGENYKNLHLLNTKLDFVNPVSSSDKSEFFFNNPSKDIINSTSYLNFLKGDTADSYSSHFMPTAYWNNAQNRWSYLSSSYTQISSNFRFDQYDQNYNNLAPNYPANVSGVNNDHLKDNLSYYNRSVLTTPGFRNDGSFIKNNTSNQYNKSMLCQITDSYGFPYKNNWQPTNDHLINMSKYLAKDFLLEKVIIKGKYTSKAEMPVKKGNYSSNFGNSITSLNDFESPYDYKDDHKNYLSNSVTFFLLNEQKNQNFFDQKIKIEPVQHYTFVLGDSVNISTFGKSFGKKLSDYPGTFGSGEIEKHGNNLNVQSYIVENDAIYSFDNYNDFNLNANKYGSSLIPYQANNFYYLDSSSSSETAEDTLYYKSRASWTTSNYNDNLITNSNIIAKKIKESTNDFNQLASRELVTYSNMLITKKLSNVELDDRLLENIDLHEVSIASSEDEMHINQDTPKSFEIKSLCKNNNIFSDYSDESEFKIKSNYSPRITINEPTRSKFSINISHPSPYTAPNIKLFTTEESHGIPDSNSTIASIFGRDLKTEFGVTSLNNIAEMSSFFFSTNSYDLGILRSRTLNKFNLSLRNLSNNQVKTFVKVYFTFLNPKDNSNYDYNIRSYGEHNDNPYASGNNQEYVYLQDFIRYNKYSSGSDHYNEIFINLRFLDTWEANSSILSFLNSGRTSTSSNLSPVPAGTVFEFLSDNDAINNNILVNRNSSWGQIDDDLPKWNTDHQNLAISLLIYHAIFNTSFRKNSHPFNNTSDNSNEFFINPFTGQSNIRPEFDILEFDSGIVKFEKGSDNFNYFIHLEETTRASKVYSFFDENNNVLLNDLVTEADTDFLVANKVIGVPAELDDEIYYNANYILEGRFKGTNNIEIESNRVINKKPLTDTIIPEFLTKSGKIIHEGKDINQTVKSNYVLKSTDNLVFGVSSNCNGQVMPTIFKLHDRLEITLIGRDYIDNKIEYKNNESKAIRKVVIGDEYISKLGDTIYETKGSYYDNVWDKFSLNDSFNEFVEGKNILSLNSSRDEGTYSGIITLTSENRLLKNNDEVIIYNKDTIQPSIGNVFKNCLNLTEIEGINHVDEKEIKIIISENFENSNNSLNIINKWHNTFHLDTFSSFFGNDTNIRLNDTTSTNIDNKGLDICIYYDIESYKTNPTLKEFISYANANLENYNNSFNDNQKSNLLSEIKFKGKSIKDFILPSSLLKNYQNGILIKNEKNYNVYENQSQKTLNYIKSDINIQRNTNSNNKKIFINRYTSSLQYFDATLCLSQRKFGTNLNYDRSKYIDIINRNSLNYIVNDSKESSDNLETYNPQWHLVIELPFASFNLMLGIADSDLNNPPYPVTDYIGKELFIDLENVSKSCKVIRTDESNKIATLAIPLYFWETLEIDTTRYFNNNSDYYDSTRIINGRINNVIENNIFNHHATSPMSYAKLSTDPTRNGTWTWPSQIHESVSKFLAGRDTGGDIGVDIGYSIYKPFVNKEFHNSLEIYDFYTYPNLLANPTYSPIQMTYDTNINSITDGKFDKIPFILPYSIKQLLALSIDQDPDDCRHALIVNRDYNISLSSFVTLDNKTPVYSNKGQNIDKLNNFYKLENSKRYFTHERYFENNISQVSARETNGLQTYDVNESLNINEKVYRSKIYKKSINNEYLASNYYLIYKIHDLTTNHSIHAGSDVYPYKVIETIAIDTDNLLFEKRSLSKEDLLAGFSNTDIIRIYENDLLEDNYFSNDINSNTPYFEIDFSSKSKSFDVSAGTTVNGIDQILNSHLKIDVSTNISSSLSTTTTGQLGTPIYTIEDNKEKLYKSFNSQEDAIKNFFYGFSKGKYRYPIEKLDGFKYGVQSGSPQTLKVHFSNKRFGMFADKIMGTMNYSVVSKDTSGKNIVEYSILKRFVDANYKYLTSTGTIRYTYNIDERSRSVKPFIEQSSS